MSNGGSVTFVNYNNAAKVFRALLRHYNNAVKTVASLCISNCGLLSLDIKVSLALSSFYNHLILALVVTKSA